MRDVYYTYIVRCADGTYYTGFTTDVAARTAQHNAGKGAKYTRSRLPVREVWHVAWETEHEARRCEWYVKRLTHAQKAQLASGKRRSAAYRTVWERLLAQVVGSSGN